VVDVDRVVLRGPSPEQVHGGLRRVLLDLEHLLEADLVGGGSNKVLFVWCTENP
jgi:hypothetical protein